MASCERIVFLIKIGYFVLQCFLFFVSPDHLIKKENNTKVVYNIKYENIHTTNFVIAPRPHKPRRERR